MAALAAVRPVQPIRSGGSASQWYASHTSLKRACRCVVSTYGTSSVLAPGGSSGLSLSIFMLCCPGTTCSTSQCATISWGMLVAGYFSADSPNPELHLSRGPCGKDIEELVALALRDENQPDAEDVRAFQSIVGALLYQRSYEYAPGRQLRHVGMLCRAMSRPTPALMAAALRVLGYLDRTKDIGLRYEASDVELYGMSDSDWGVKHSTSG